MAQPSSSSSAGLAGASAAPPRLPSDGWKGSSSSGSTSSRSRTRSSSLGNRVAYCMDKIKRAATPERLLKRLTSRSREVSPVSVSVRPRPESCWEEESTAVPRLQEAVAAPCLQETAEVTEARLQQEAAVAVARSFFQASGSADCTQAPGSVAAQSERSLAKAQQSDDLAAPVETSSHPQGGVTLNIDFCGPSAKRRGPPPAVLARLSRPSGGKPPNVQPNNDVTVGAGKSRRQRPPVPSTFERPKRVGFSGSVERHLPSLSNFMDASAPTEFLADHDAIELDESVANHILTTEGMQTLCKDLHSLDAVGVRQLLAWREELRHERDAGEGKMPEQADVDAIGLDEAKQHTESAPSTEATANVSGSSPTAVASPAANVIQQAEGVAAAMAQALEAIVGEEDKDVLAGLVADIERLTQALKQQNLSSKQSYAIRKQLGALRSQKARAERAVRQGRKAKLEISDAGSAAQAIIDSLPTPTRGSGRPDSFPTPAGDVEDPSSLVHAQVLQGQESGSLVQSLPPGFGASEAQGSATLALAGLLHPETLLAAGSSAIGRLGLTAKSLKAIALDSVDPGFGETAWRCVCQTFAQEFALWCPQPLKISEQGYWHKLMFEQLWPARMKWMAAEAAAPRRLGEMGIRSEQGTQDFQIQVSVRFKPGSVKQARLLVPLHQKLLLLRKNGADLASKIGNKEPPEFLDALMGHLMVDPVLLPSSGKVCDRNVVEGQLRQRDGVDPFDGSPLTLQMLEPQEELRARISDWRADLKKRKAEDDDGNKLEEEEIRELISELGGNLDSEVVEMLLEAEQLRAAGKRALQDASSQRKRRGDADAEAVDEEAAEGENARAWWDENVSDLAAAAGEAMPTAGQRVIDGRFMQETAEEELGDAPTRDGPKVLAVAAPTRVVMFQPGAGIRPFVFARVFDGEATQEDVYENTVRGSVCAALNGFNACLLCYGQTGSGKTHTMFGQSVAAGGNAGAVVSQHSGSVMRSLREVFNAAADLESACGVVTQISAQYVQIYQDRVACLMTGNTVSLREAVPGAPVLLQGAAETQLEGLVDASQMIATGEERKRYAETAMNHRSSRAHTVLAIKVTQQRGDLVASAQLHLVDLAGSERVKKSRAQGGRLVEAVGINSSLMVLGQCIAARVADRPHVPYYESRLTLLLRSALGGNSRTSVVICCHKEDAHGDETLQALSFGERCAMVSNRAHAALAASASEAAAAVSEALAECSKQIECLEKRGKGHLPACEKLRKRHATLSRRQREQADRVSAKEIAAEST